MVSVYDVIIIGAGPAGLSAAIYAMRAKLNALVIEQAGPGGQVLTTYEVDNYPALPGISGYELGVKMKEHAEKLGMKLVSEEVREVIWEQEHKCVRTDRAEYETKTLILASGAVHAKLGLPDEERLSGMGVSYCATCDGAFYKNAVTAVVGGGDVALEDAIFLARLCKKVYVIHRRNEFRGAKTLQEALFQLPNVEILWDSVVTSIHGEDEVEGITVENCLNGSKERYDVDGVFIAVGIRPVSEVFDGLAERDKAGYLIAGEDTKTSTPGIFAAGDVRTKSLRQIVTAVADGANAVYAVQEYLTGIIA
ncbi:MAG: thioredoxin-disulfide reductase [Lachnospiraceae bacterium]